MWKVTDGSKRAWGKCIVYIGALPRHLSLGCTSRRRNDAPSLPSAFHHAHAFTAAICVRWRMQVFTHHRCTHNVRFLSKPAAAADIVRCRKRSFPPACIMRDAGDERLKMLSLGLVPADYDAVISAGHDISRMSSLLARAAACPDAPVNRCMVLLCMHDSVLSFPRGLCEQEKGNVTRHSWDPPACPFLSADTRLRASQVESRANRCAGRAPTCMPCHGAFGPCARQRLWQGGRHRIVIDWRLSNRKIRAGDIGSRPPCMDACMACPNFITSRSMKMCMPLFLLCAFLDFSIVCPLPAVQHAHFGPVAITCD